MERVALITAAGSGLGAACAREMAAAGFRVAVASSSGKGEALGKELGGLGFTASNLSPEDIERIVRDTHAAFGRIDAVINSCGSVPRGELLEIADSDWHAGFDMIFMSVVRIARAVTPLMIAQGGGAIVNLSSFAAVEPDLAFPVSSPLRAALGNFAKLYATRYAAQKIRMNNILPGYFETRWPARAEVAARIPAGRYGDPAEFAKTAAFLASDGASYINGQNIVIDGGATRSF